MDFSKHFILLKKKGEKFSVAQILDFWVMTQVSNFKCLLVGDRFCGKSTFIEQFVDEDDERTHLLTKDVSPVTFSTNLGTICFDIYEADALHGNRDTFYQKAHCAIILFDVTSRSTFDNILYWHRKIISLNRKIPIALCANKVDIKMRKVYPEDALSRWRSRMGCFEMSAKGKVNINDPFIYLIEKIMNTGAVTDIAKIGSEVSVNLSSLHRLIEEAKEKNNVE